MPPDVRDAESRAVLRDAGVPDENIVFLHTAVGRVPDLKLAHLSLESLEALECWIEKAAFSPARLYAPSYEGGHPDHDAAHLIAAAVASRRKILTDAWHFSLYNGYRCWRPFFATMRQLPTRAPSRPARIPVPLRWSAAFACWHYRSQWRTWMGLFPGALYARVIACREHIVSFDVQALRRPPHDGELLYERMFSTTYGEFEQRMRAVRAMT